MERFVVLEHRWEGTHWDLMLDVGHALRTWAIDAPIVAGVELPARALADHRRAYLDYEGEVSGGRGTVRRLDQGLYEPLIWTADRVLIRLEGAQLAGEAELRRIDVGPIENSLGWVFRLGNAD